MLKRIFPDRFDNDYRGSPIAVWLMALLAVLDIGVGVMAIVSPDSAAQSADGIPLFSFTLGGASTIIGLAAFLGLGSLLMGVLYGLAVLRYRSMIPLMYLFVLAGFLGRRVIGAFKPIAHQGGHPGFALVTAMALAAGIGLALSLTGPRYRLAAAV